MDADRERHITSIFHSAIERGAAERAAYLDGACGADRVLRTEVEALLVAHEQAGSFIESPAVERAAAILSDGPSTDRAGQIIGPYKIISTLGAGGMGVVYKAHDTRLDREVALKLLPDGLSEEADSVRRFQQEARAASALNHPNILSIFDFGEHEGAPYIVSELLIGETMREKLKGTPLQLRRALDYALQTARGLAAAQEKGIVHRDLKPENLFVTKDGRVKILDFGIAKLIQHKPLGQLNSEAPTLINTDPGMVLGTVGYMSPEQVRGSTVDHRSDIFAFGAILYEMLSGRRAFRGDSMVETLNAILKDEPPELSATNEQISSEVTRVVRRCLEKEPEQRFQSASDLAFAVESLSITGAPVTTNPVTIRTPTLGKPLKASKLLGWALAAMLLLTTIGFAVLYFRRSETTLETVRFTITPPANVNFAEALALSPNGQQLAFIVRDANGSTSLWVRDFDSVMPRQLAGTIGANFPFWSPDGHSIGFFADNMLKRIDVAGGAAQVLGNASIDSRGASWGADGTILFAPHYTGPLLKISASGGAVQPATELDPAIGEDSHRWPEFLPDGKHFLFFFKTRQENKQGIYIGRLGQPKSKFLVKADVRGVYAAIQASDGALLFVRDQSLFAQHIDLTKLELTGDPVVIAEDVASFPSDEGPTGYTSVAAKNGRLVYLSNRITHTRLDWFNRDGKVVEPVAETAKYGEPWLSPDGKKIAFEQIAAQFADLWILDIARKTTTRFTFDPANDVGATWSPDGNSILFASNRTGKHQLYKRLASGAGTEELLLPTELTTFPDDWKKLEDGREVIVFDMVSLISRFDIYVFPLYGDHKPIKVISTEFNETHAQISPDGKFIAYASDASGRSEIYVQTFPVTGAKWQISTSGGDQPQWRHDGSELFYMSADKKLMAVKTTAAPSFNFSSPVALFQTRVPSTLLNADRNNYVVSIDGQRFLVNSMVESEGVEPITVVWNWASALK